MKIVVTFKSPDAVSYAAQDLEEEGATEDLMDMFNGLCSKHFAYGEYCYIELDLETGEAKLLDA